MANKKRRRSESFQDDNDDARKRLADFHARMFELPQQETSSAAPETPRVVFKTKHKKRKNKFGGGDDVEDGESVPMVKFNQNKSKKEKKLKKKTVKVVEKVEKKVNGPEVVKVPGAVKKQDKAAKKHDKTAKKVAKVEKQSVVAQALKKTVKVQTSAHAPQEHSMQSSEVHEDEMDPLEQALISMKEIGSKKSIKPPHNKHKTVTGKAVAAPKTEKSQTVVKESTSAVKRTPDDDAADGPTEYMTKSKKKRRKEKLRKLRMQAETEQNASKTTAEHRIAQTDDVKTGSASANGTVNTAATVKKNVNESSSLKAPAASPKSPRSRKKRKKSPKAKTPTSVSPKTQTPSQPRQGKPLDLSDEPESQLVGKRKVLEVKTVSVKKGKTSSKSAAQQSTKVEKKNPAATKSLTPIAASLAKDSQKKDDMFVEIQEQIPKAPKRVAKVAAPQIVHITDEQSSESEDDEGFDFKHADSDNESIYSRLIDSAARERWELIEVGRLVRLFAAEWGMKASKTARFLNETCPELVSVDFLEGLGVNLSAKQLVGIFEAGSGNSGVLMNKMASAVENGHLSVRDPSFVSALERRVALMESNGEVMELLHPLLESLSTVRDVGCLLKQLCKHWQLERKIALVQQVLLSNVFDDLDGNQDEILLDLPDLTGRLDFPSRLDQEDVDEKGNLKGFLANSDSEFSGEEGSEEESEEEDSEADEEPFEGESDSEEETDITGSRRGRHHFIEDEADVGEEDEEGQEEEERERRDDDDSSSSDSDSD